MNITFKQIRLFLALAESGSVSAAAKLMHVTQPTASMQLKEITQSVGLPLYEVINKKIFLTDLGNELVATGRVMTQTWESFEQTVDAMKGLSRGKVKIASVSTAKYFMPRIVGSFCKKYPSIDISLEILNRDGVVQRLRENLDDIYIMSQPPGDLDLADEIFMPNPIVVISSTANQLAKKSKIKLSELAQERFILREKGSGTRMVGDLFFRKKKFKPNVRLELGSNEALKESVAAGLGLGLVSSYALHGHVKEHGVCIIDVEGFPLPSSWHIVHPARKKLSPLALAFKQHLEKQVNNRKI